MRIHPRVTLLLIHFPVNTHLRSMKLQVKRSGGRLGAVAALALRSMAKVATSPYQGQNGTMYEVNVEALNPFSRSKYGIDQDAENNWVP